MTWWQWIQFADTSEVNIGVSLLRRVSICSIGIVVVFLLSGCGDSGISRQELMRELEKQSPRFQFIVDSLDKHYEIHEKYPLSLSELNIDDVPPVLVLQEHSHVEPSGLKYSVARDRSFFRLSYGLTDTHRFSHGYTFASYSSPDRKWDYSTYLNSLPHVESRYYGALFAETRTTASLEMAVSSLLDAARGNATALPCRNFWRSWVDTALGQGQGTSYDFQHSPGLEARLYSSMDEGRSYMFLFRDKLFPPMTKPLSIVVAVYRTHSIESGEWVLHQQCGPSS